MGSVVALLSLSGRPDPDVVTRMVHGAPHRGLEITSASLGHAVVGVGRGDGIWSQEVAASDALVLAVSGAIDNWRDVGHQVRAGGGEIADDSPASVLLAAIELFGFEVLGRLRGVYAAIATDGETLWCFRDHIGFRPLFVQRTSRAVVVASEIKQVVAGSPSNYEPDIDVVQLGFFGRLGDDRRSPIRGVERVKAGAVLRADRTGTRTERYWEPEALLETGPAPGSPHELQEQFDALLVQAVRRSLTGHDVLSLSGGIDSTAIGAYAAPAFLAGYGRPLLALSAVYPEFPAVDEREYIETAAQRFATPLTTYVSQVAPTDGMEDWVRLCDGPVRVVSLSETDELLRHAKALGCRNALTGELAELVFDMRWYVLQHLLVSGRLAAAGRQVAALHSRGLSGSRIARQVISTFVPASLGALYSRRGSVPYHGPRWIDPAKIPPPPYLPAGKRWTDGQLFAFADPGQALEADDYVQSHVGVTIRRPWADIDLWEFFLRLPAEVKFPQPGSKYLVRSLLRGRVPDVILDREDKTVFDEHIAAHIDYSVLRKWLIKPAYQVDGVDYRVLADLLHDESLTLTDFMWAKDLAAVHAFLAQF